MTGTARVIGRMISHNNKSRRKATYTQRLWWAQQGQSLLEVALILPIFTILICYSIDMGYFFMAATTINAAARSGVEYAVQGSSSPSQSSQPSAAVVSNLAINSIGLAGASTSTISVQVCSRAVGVNVSNNTAQCTSPSTGAGAVSGTPDVDPESPTFQLNRVDVVYTITSPIPIPASIFPTRTFHRMVEMRSIQ